MTVCMYVRMYVCTFLCIYVCSSVSSMISCMDGWMDGCLSVRGLRCVYVGLHACIHVQSHMKTTQRYVFIVAIA